MRLNLLDRVQSHADYNQQGGSSKIEGDMEFLAENRGQDANSRHINRSSKSDPSEHFVDILGGFLPGTDAGDIAAEFFHIIGDIIRIEGDGGIKITKEEDETHVEKIVNHSTPAHML